MLLPCSIARGVDQVIRSKTVSEKPNVRLQTNKLSKSEERKPHGKRPHTG